MIEVDVLLLVIGESVLLLFWEVESFFSDRGRALLVLLLIRRGRTPWSGTQCFHLVPEPPACTSLVTGLGPISPGRRFPVPGAVSADEDLAGLAGLGPVVLRPWLPPRPGRS